MTPQFQALSSPVSKPRCPRWGLVLGSLALVAACVATRYYWGLEAATAQAPATEPAAPAPAASTAADPATLSVVAVVNGEEISREELARECLRRHGREVLETMVNRQLIAQECQRQNLAVPPSEAEAEIERLANSYGMPVEQWLKMACRDHNCTADQYRDDVVWPTLALRKLAGEQLQVTAEEIEREYEAKYGPSIKARLICCDTRSDAEAVLALAQADPESFGNLAKEHSKDASASVKGLLQPIRKTGGDSSLEAKIQQVAFELKDGEISSVIPLANQYVILKREEKLAGRDEPMTEAIRVKLEENIRERKMEPLAHAVFGRLQKQSRIENVLNDAAKSEQMPGVAAVVNGQALMVRELAEAALARHGQEVLELVIQRRLLEQACKKGELSVSDADVDEEIAREAAASLPSKADGSPDTQGWLKLVCQQQGTSPEAYRREVIWPRMVLQKLVGEIGEPTDEEIQNAYEATYGARVRCRAIVLDNLRRAQQVWELARQGTAGKPLEKAEMVFGELAEQYSMESSSRALKGEVRPIQRNGGQPFLEKEAFELKPGELSSIIPAGADYFVILFCVGHTRPVEIELAAVREQIRQDVQEKKRQRALDHQARQILAEATIENRLTGTTRSPQQDTQQPETQQTSSDAGPAQAAETAPNRS